MNPSVFSIHINFFQHFLPSEFLFNVSKVTNFGYVFIKRFHITFKKLPVAWRQNWKGEFQNCKKTLRKFIGIQENWQINFVWKVKKVFVMNIPWLLDKHCLFFLFVHKNFNYRNSKKIMQNSHVLRKINDFI